MRTFRYITVVLIACAGCTSPLRSWQEITAPPYSSPYSSTDLLPATAPKSSAATTARTPSNPASALSGTTATPTELATVMADVQQIGAQDPEAQQALLEDMKRTDPSLWPQLIRAFRSSLAYRQQSSARLAQTAPVQQPAAVATSNSYPSTAIAAPPSMMQQVGYSDTPQYQPYPTTAAPSATIVRPVAVSPQSMPETAEGLLVPRSPPAELGRSYPDTMLPAVRLINADNARAIQSADRSGSASVADTTSPPPSEPADWHEPLSTAIRTLESKMAASSSQQASAADEARLRLLYLAGGRRDEATNPLPGATPEAHEFWSQEAAGLATLLDDQRISDSQRRAEEAARHLHAAANELEQNGPLALAHLAFCTEVNSFGVYKKFPKYEFKRGEEVLLYAEVENFTSTTTEAGYHTSLHSGVQILNSAAIGWLVRISPSPRRIAAICGTTSSCGTSSTFPRILPAAITRCS